MRKLLVKLADEKVYTFTTLTYSEHKALMDKEESSAFTRMRFLQKKEGAVGLSEEEFDELSAIENKIDGENDKMLGNMMKGIVISLGKAHPEFKSMDIEEAKKRLEEIMDLYTMQLVFKFALTGTIDKEEDVKPSDIINIASK
jgi:UDP-N-acetyl-D-mannosaminuronate dehydrogenase